MALSLSLVLLCVALVHQSCQQSTNASTSLNLTSTTLASTQGMTSMPILIITITSDFVTPTAIAVSSSAMPSSMTLGPVLTQTTVRTGSTVRTQTTVASLPTLLPTTSSMSMADLYTLPSVLPSGHLPSSSRSSPPSTELPTESSPRNAIEFVRKYPIATSIVGATALFLTCTFACLFCAIIYHKRRLKRKRRQPSALDSSNRDVFIVNPVALQATPPNQTPEDSPALPNVNPLQGVQNEALIVSNPQAETSFVPPQYHGLLSTATNPHPSAPPKHHINPQLHPIYK